MIEITGHEDMGGVFTKTYLGGLPFAAVFHEFHRADNGDPHDHPWDFTSHIIQGGYREEVFTDDGCGHIFDRPVGTYHIKAERIHRIVDMWPDTVSLITLDYGLEPRPVHFYKWEDGVMFRRRAGGDNPWEKVDV